MAVLSPPDWLKQSDALIVAQGIDAQPHLLSNLLDSQPCFHTTSIRPGVNSRSRGCQVLFSFTQVIVNVPRYIIRWSRGCQVLFSFTLFHELLRRLLLVKACSSFKRGIRHRAQWAVIPWLTSFLVVTNLNDLLCTSRHRFLARRWLSRVRSRF